jgi:hypothetical protein
VFGFNAETASESAMSLGMSPLGQAVVLLHVLERTAMNKPLFENDKLDAYHLSIDYVASMYARASEVTGKDPDDSVNQAMSLRRTRSEHERRGAEQVWGPMYERICRWERGARN